MSEELILRSRAKVNIGLKIQNKRSDGFHNIHTLFQELDLHDTITLCRADSGCHFFSFFYWLDNSSDNLCVKAWMRMGKLFDIKGISIHLEKIIPAGSGLGGGSSNAAAILKGINRLYELGLERKELESIASSIGADVPFFIRGGIQLGEGIGEVLTRVNTNIEGTYLLVIPRIHINTAWAFSAYKILLQDDKEKVNFKSLIERDNISFKFFENDFESIIVPSYPKIGSIKDTLRDSSARFASLSGSGSTVYAIFDDEADAKSVESQFSRSHITFITQPYLMDT